MITYNGQYTVNLKTIKELYVEVKQLRQRVNFFDESAVYGKTRPPVRMRIPKDVKNRSEVLRQSRLEHQYKLLAWLNTEKQRLINRLKDVDWDEMGKIVLGEEKIFNKHMNLLMSSII